MMDMDHHTTSPLSPLSSDEHQARGRALLATLQNVPTPADLAEEAAREGRDLRRYARLLLTGLTCHHRHYASAAVPAPLALPLTRYFVRHGCSVRHGPARTSAHVTLTLYRS